MIKIRCKKEKKKKKKERNNILDTTRNIRYSSIVKIDERKHLFVFFISIFFRSCDLRRSFFSNFFFFFFFFVLLHCTCLGILILSFAIR